MQDNHDDLLNTPLPSARIPAVLALTLLGAVVLFYLCFLRAPAQLLGPPIQTNAYQAKVAPAPKPAVITPVQPTVTPLAAPVPAPAARPATPAPVPARPVTPTATPITPAATPHRAPSALPVLPAARRPAAHPATRRPANG
jgi:hypothetical protein